MKLLNDLGKKVNDFHSKKSIDKKSPKIEIEIKPEQPMKEESSQEISCPHCQQQFRIENGDDDESKLSDTGI